MQCHTGGVLLFISNLANNPKMAEYFAKYCPSRKHVVIFSEQSLYPEHPEMKEVFSSLEDNNFELCFTQSSYG